MKKLILVGCAVLALSLTSCDTSKKTEADAPGMESADTEMSTEGDRAMMEEEKGETVADIAMANDNFSTLEAAVQAAGLESTLQGDGPFTVFAPTNDAFAKIPEATLTDLLKPENKAKLTSILTYHVVSGEFAAQDVIKAIKDNNGTYEINTVEGGKLTATLDGDKVILTDANNGKSTVTMTDVKGSNGVIHAIDTVLMPKA